MTLRAVGAEAGTGKKAEVVVVEAQGAARAGANVPTKDYSGTLEPPAKLSGNATTSDSRIEVRHWRIVPKGFLKPEFLLFRNNVHGLLQEAQMLVS